MSREKRVLAAVADHQIFGRLETLFEMAAAEVGRAQDCETALALGFRQSFDLVISDFPLGRIDLTEFLDRLRGPGSLSVDCPVLKLSQPPFTFEGGLPWPHRAPGVAALDSEIELLRATSLELDLDDRVRETLLVQIEADGDAARIEPALQTENISRSGMLLKTGRLLPVGTVLPFRLGLPYDRDPVVGRGKVVRHADAVLEGLRGLGVQFLGLDADGRDRLGGFLEFARAIREPLAVSG